MLTFISVIVFYILLSLLVIYVTRRHNYTLTRKEIFLTFGFKVLMGCIYGLIFLHYYKGDDTWAIHLQSLKEWELLKSDPLLFFREYTPETAIRNAKNSGNFLTLYLADLEYCLLVKTLGIFNIISQGNYFINVVLFNFIFFWGHYWLYQTVVSQFPQKRIFLLLVIFFVPTAVFWLSGIRGDGILFFFFSTVIFSFYRYLQTGRIRNLLLTVAGLIGMFIFRSGVAILLIPGLISWYLVYKHNKKTAIAFTSIYGICLLIFFATSLFPKYNVPAMLSEKQAQFFKLNGNTRYTLNVLDPSLSGFAETLPQAFLNTFLRPLIWEVKGPLQLIASLGILLFLIVMFVVFRSRIKSAGNQMPHHPTSTLLLVFAIFNYFLIGLTVPFPGAIVRYKSIAEICFFIAFILLFESKSERIKNN